MAKEKLSTSRDENGKEGRKRCACGKLATKTLISENKGGWDDGQIFETPVCDEHWVPKSTLEQD